MPLDLSTFDFEEQAVRVIMRDGAPWFVAADVCRVLEIANSRDATSSLDEDERDTVNLITVGLSDGSRGNPNVTIISESGLYSLCFRSDKPAARRFRKWITSEVIPAIRRTGQYRHSDIGPDRDPFADLDDLTARTQIAWLQMVREARILGGANAGKRLWAKSPLPRWDDDDGEIVLHDQMIVRFLREACEVTGQRCDSLRSADLWLAYQAWCLRIGHPGAAARGFQLQIKSLSRVYRAPGTGAMFAAGKASVSMYFGIRLRVTPDPVADA